jgi:hypothetical protein
MLLIAGLCVPMKASGDRAVVIKDDACMVLDGENGVAAADGSITVLHKNGWMYTCKAKGVFNPSHHEVRYDSDSTGGWPCVTPEGLLTYDWQETVSASGNVTLSCHANENEKGNGKD